MLVTLTVPVNHPIPMDTWDILIFMLWDTKDQNSDIIKQKIRNFIHVYMVMQMRQISTFTLSFKRAFTNAKMIQYMSKMKTHY